MQEVRVVFELPHDLSDTANWDVGVQLLWSEDGSELTRFGLRPAHNLTGTDLVDIHKGDLQTVFALANAAACEAACKTADGCLVRCGLLGACLTALHVCSPNCSLAHWS